MAIARIKTWIAEVLTYAELNAEFDNILNNGGGSLGSPRTAAFDLDANQLILDADSDTYLIASTDDIVDFYGQSTRLVRFDLSVASPVNGLTFAATATGNPPTVTAYGADTNISINVIPKGTGTLQVNGVAVSTSTLTEDQMILSALIFG